jgi:hypothetical protein
MRAAARWFVLESKTFLHRPARVRESQWQKLELGAQRLGSEL